MVLLDTIEVLKPVVDLELDPRSRKQIDDGGWFERPWGLASSLSLIMRGFGVINSSSLGARVYCLGTLRPNRIPADPMQGRS